MSEVSAPSGRIFISYRREESAYPAGWLFDSLTEHFGDGQVVQDVDTIEPGDDFIEVISAAVGSCDVLLALIGPQWLVITDADGRRRLDRADDLVRVEVEAALRRKVRVVPILVGGARMPRADELPDSLEGLTRRQALELSPSPGQFVYDTGRLLRVLEKTFEDLSGPPGPPRQQPPPRQATPTPPPRRAAAAPPPRQRTPAQPPPGPTPTPAPWVRWAAAGLFVAVLLVQLAVSDETFRADVAASRPRLPRGETWTTLLWLLPGVTAALAALLVVRNKRVGVALGLAAGAALWVVVSLSLLREPETATRSVHVLLLALLVAGIAVVVASTESARRRPGIAPWGGEGVVALALVAAAVVLRALPGIPEEQAWWEGGLAWWITVLIPLLVGLPAVALRLDSLQYHALLAVALVLVVYETLVRAALVYQGTRLNADAAGDRAKESLVFLAGTLCLLAAVAVGQRRRAT